MRFSFQDQNSESAQNYLNAARGIDDHPFGITSSEEVQAAYNVEGDKVVLFKKVSLWADNPSYFSEY